MTLPNNPILANMRPSVLLLTCLLLTSVARAQFDREAMERARVRTNGIKECIQYTHKHIQNAPSPEGYKTSHTTYNREGDPIEIVNYRANGEISSRHTYAYNEQGLKIEYRKEEKAGGKDMRVFFKQNFTYDSKGNKKTESGFDGSANYRVVYNYLPNGNLADVTRYNSDNSVAERWIYTYDGNKQIIRVTLKNAKPYTVEKVYDAQGHLLNDCQFDSEGNEARRIAYTYTKDGRIATETESYAGEKRHVLTYVFDAKNQLVQVLRKMPDGKEVVNNDYKYDNEGNLVTEKWLDGTSLNLVSKKDSEFDGQGNMVKVDSYYAPYKYRVTYTYEYKKF